MKTLVKFLTVVLVAFAVWPAFAQVTQETADAVRGFDRELARIEEGLTTAGDDDDALVELYSRTRLLEEQLLKAGVTLSPRLAEIVTRLDQLGKEQEGEPETVAQQRAELTAERSLINSLIGQLEDMSVRSHTIESEIAERRLELFTATLSRRYDVAEAFRADLIADVQNRYETLVSRIASWARFAWRYKSGSILAATSLSLMAAVLFLVFARRLLGRLIRRDPAIEDPSYFSRLAVGFLGTLLPALGIWVFLVLIYALYDYFAVLRGDIGQLLLAIFLGIGVITLITQLAEAIFAPRLSQWRLINVTDRAARVLEILVVCMAVTIVADETITRILRVIGDSIPITIAKSLISSTVVGLILLAISAVRPFAGPAGARDRKWHPIVRIPLQITGVTLIVAVAAGYIGFADFASKQIVITGAVAVTLYIGYLAARAMSRENALLNSRFGRWLRETFELSDLAIDQLGLFAGILLTVLLFLFGAPVLLLFWGFKWGDIRDRFLGVATEFSIGSITISITGIIAGIFVFIVGFWLTKLFQRWLDRDVLTRSRVDNGVRNSVRTGVGYVGVTIAALVGVAAAGINLSQLALVAGALSLGIGFGLQNIVSNFVSGLILLVERPFKVGDWIEAGGVSGTVKAINVRATEIETFQRKSVMLPNSELINSAVGNWTHRNTLGRIDIPVGVAYKSDPRMVREILLDIAHNCTYLLSNPEPYVSFNGFGDSSLDFELRGYLANVGDTLTAGTEMRIEILERFNAAGIEIPFPQRDVNLKVSGKETGPAEAEATDYAEIGPDLHLRGDE